MVLLSRSGKHLAWCLIQSPSAPPHALFHYALPSQDCFTDALSSVQTGRPFWHWAINVCTHSSYKKINKVGDRISCLLALSLNLADS